MHRRDSFRAEKILIERLAARPNVASKWNRAVEEILAGGSPRGVTGVAAAQRRDRRDRGTRGRRRVRRDRPCAGERTGAGPARAQAERLCATTPGSTATSVEGVFAAGDVADDVFRQAVTAAGLGCMAALEADRWLAAQAPAREAAE